MCLDYFFTSNDGRGSFLFRRGRGGLTISSSRCGRSMFVVSNENLQRFFIMIL